MDEFSDVTKKRVRVDDSGALSCAYRDLSPLQQLVVRQDNNGKPADDSRWGFDDAHGKGMIAFEVDERGRPLPGGRWDGFEATYSDEPLNHD